MRKITKIRYLHLALLQKCCFSCSDDVGEIIDDQIIQQRQFERKYLLDVIKCFRYLARQGIPFYWSEQHDGETGVST